MPSQTKSWITLHPPLALLHVTSTDPRRGGSEDLAMFEMDLVPLLSMHQFRIRSGVIQSNEGKTLLSMVADARGLGTCQIEPNCDYTKDNFRKRAGPGINNFEHIEKYRAKNKDWRGMKTKITFFPRMPGGARKKEWTLLEVPLMDGGTISIKINKYLVEKIPTKLVYRPKRRFNKLFLPPNSEQLKRPKYDDDHRHGRALTQHLLEAAGCASTRNTRLVDYDDYRIDPDNLDFIGSLNVKNYWRAVPGVGTVLKITTPAFYHKSDFKFRPAHCYPNDKEFLAHYTEKWAYYLLDDAVLDTVKDAMWLMDTTPGKHEPVAMGELEWNNEVLYKPAIKLIICEATGNAVRNVFIQSRLNKYYEATLGNMDKKKLRSRAKFENMIASEKHSNNSMYTQSRIISRRHIHCDKHINVEVSPGQTITALDMRMQSIRIGGNKA